MASAPAARAESVADAPSPPPAPREAFDESLIVRPLGRSGALLLHANLSVSVRGDDRDDPSHGFTAPQSPDDG